MTPEAKETKETKITVDLASFQEAVAAKIAGINATVLDRVVDHYGEVEATRRVPLIIEGIKQKDAVKASLGKFKSENLYDEKGEVTSSYWTKGTLDGKRKAEETLKKWEDALGLAITDSNFAFLEKLLKGGGNDQQKQPKEDAEQSL